MALSIPALVETEWLADHLNHPVLRVLDCTVILSFHPETGRRQTTTGRPGWEEAHIPGSAFVDLIEDLSETENPRFPMQMPTPGKFAREMGRLGIGDDTGVVLYDSGNNMWAARVWWMLRAFGFDNAGVLNGGWAKWISEGRPFTTEAVLHPNVIFTPRPRPKLIADKAEVLDSIGSDSTCILNALSPEDHAGKYPRKYGRGGRIPTSVNVPATGDASIIDPATNTYVSLEELSSRFGEVGATSGEKVITYCGGGIAASSAAFALHLISVDNVAVYDGSLSEWAKDPTLPMESGEPGE